MEPHYFFIWFGFLYISIFNKKRGSTFVTVESIQQTGKNVWNVGDLLRRKKHLLDALEKKLMKNQVLNVEARRWIRTKNSIINPYKKRKTCWYGHEDYASATQISMDSYCISQSPFFTSCARCKEVNGTIFCFCVEILYLDYSIESNTCITNCGSLTRCMGESTKSSSIPIYNAEVIKNISKNCVFSQLQESLDSYCKEKNSVSRLDENYGIKCYSKNVINYSEKGICLNDCRQQVSCSGYPKEGQGVTLDISTVKWDNLTNGCPCTEEYMPGDVKYFGCQNVASDGKPCKNWFTSLSSRNGLYRLRFLYPKNYCREIPRRIGIWCLTDIDVLAPCTMKEHKEIELQLGSLFDIWITPYIPKYRINIKFLMDGSICGYDFGNAKNIFQSRKHYVYEVSGNDASSGSMDDNPYYPSLTINGENSAVYKGFMVLEGIETRIKICGCIYSSYYDNYRDHWPCSHPTDYNLFLGKIIVKENRIPEEKIEGKVRTGIIFENDKLKLNGILSAVNESYVMEFLYEKYSIRTSMMSLEAVIELEESEMKKTKYISGFEESGYDDQQIVRRLVSYDDNTAVLKVSRAGDYILMYRMTNNKIEIVKDASPFILRRYTIKGYDSQKTFSLINDSKKQRKYRKQSLFFKSWRVTSVPIAVIISEYKDQGKCEKPMKYSTNIFPAVNSIVDKNETTWRASDFIRTAKLRDMDAESLNKFEVCVFKSDSTIESLGFGTLRDNVDHTLRELLGERLPAPENVSGYTIYDMWDLIEVHFRLDEDMIFNYSMDIKEASDKSEKVKKDFFDYLNSKAPPNEHGKAGDKYKFTSDGGNFHYQYPMILSFWCYPRENLVRLWVFKPSRLSPTYVGAISVRTPLAFDIIVTANEITAVVLSEISMSVEVYDFKVNFNKKPLNVSETLNFELRLIRSSCDKESNSCTELVSPKDMKIIHYEIDCVKMQLILLSDSGADCLILMNLKLQVVSKICRSGDNFPEISEPGYISCTTVNSESECIESFASQNDDEKSKTKYSNCFITQTRAGSLLLVKINLNTQEMKLVDVYRGGNQQRLIYRNKYGGGSSVPPALKEPVSVVAVTYASTDLIYIVESKYSKIRLLMLDSNVDDEKLFYYGHTELKGVPYSRYCFISALLMSQENKKILADQDYLLLFRISQSSSKVPDNKILGSINIVNLQDTISVNDFYYVIPEWLIFGERFTRKPKVENSGEKYNFSIRYELEIIGDSSSKDKDGIKCVNKYIDAADTVNTLQNTTATDWNGNSIHKNTIRIVPTTGELNININYIPQLTLTLRINAVGFIETKCVILKFNLACKDGYYFSKDAFDETLSDSDKHNGCLMCEVGKYNSINLIKKNINNWKECSQCPEMETTVTAGATSISQCVCMPGYFLSEGSTPRCQPCPIGTWKSVVGMQNCIGKKCYEGSYTTVVGSTTEEGRMCSCPKGYYYKYVVGDIKECAPCDKGYFCEGGVNAQKKKCTTSTTTIGGVEEYNDIDKGNSVSPAASLAECVCKSGYEPADSKKLRNKDTPEYRFMERIIGEIEEKNLDDANININALICVPCGNRRYKDKHGNFKCSYCPEHTFVEHTNATDIKQCELCDPGYFETEDLHLPCKPCTEYHYCVGSYPVDKELKRYQGKAIKCPDNSVTVEPYVNNTLPMHCICDKGYMPVDYSTFAKCVHVPKNYYKDTVGNTPAISCPYGSLTALPGSVSQDACVCDKGEYFDYETSHCTTCPAGKYCLGGKDENMKHRQPLECPDKNASTKDPGASSESECACKAGYYKSPDGQDICLECPEDHYKSYISHDACTPCDEHSSTNGNVGATSKEQCVCAPGYYFDKTCVACGYADKYCPGGVIVKEQGENSADKGSHIAKYETHLPVQCPQNTEIPPGVDTASSFDDCQCGKGFAFLSKDLINKDKICVPCMPGTYKSSVMDSGCNGFCTQNATSLPGAQSPTQCYCQSGYFYLEGGICTACLEGAKCDGGLVFLGDKSMRGRNMVVRLEDHVKPVAIEGYYLDKIQPELRKPDDWKFIKCPIKGACLDEGKCSESMTQYLCSECKTGYTNNFNKGDICRKCPNKLLNISLNILWYFGLLLVNIVMACLNVSAGFNRRSIHSVVIKIALNYGICMSVLNVVSFTELPLPTDLKSATMSWFKMFYKDDKKYYISVDCLLQEWFNMKHADSFFYSMLFAALLPIILLIVVTLLMWIILELFKIKRRKITRSKLALLQQSHVQGMQYLLEKLTDEYANERLFLIFRYIPSPGETSWVRFKHFLEDMIPIYVTVLFSLHGNTTSQMLSLLDCTCINFGRSIPSKYVLRPAMSIKCSLDPSRGYIPYLALGLGGLIVWGFGIPFLSFIVLLANRKNLYAPDVRMKYGFLHNGYQQDYWFWETIVFTRKSLVLVIGNIVIVPSQNSSGSRIWMALVVAVIFLIAQLIYKPFDERDYFVLGRLESHSMIAWTLSLLIVSLLFNVQLSPIANLIMLVLLFLNSFYFLFLVLKSLLVAFTGYLKQKRNKPILRKLGWLLNLILYFDEKRSSKEPIISYNQKLSRVELKLKRKRRTFYGGLSDRITFTERCYFTSVMAEQYRIAVSRLKLDVVPKLFIEFLIRLSLIFTRFEKKISNKNLFKDIAEGNLTRLIALATEKESNKLDGVINLDEEIRRGRGVISGICFDDGALMAAIGLRNEDLQDILNCLFDDRILQAGTNLSDFYFSTTLVWIMDKKMLTFLFEIFKQVREHLRKEQMKNAEKDNAKLKNLRDSLKKVIADDSMGLEIDQASLENMKRELEELTKTKKELENTLKEMHKNPDSYVPDAGKFNLGNASKEAVPKEGQDRNHEIEGKDLSDMLKEFGFGIGDGMRVSYDSSSEDSDSSSDDEYTDNDSVS